MWSIPRYRSPPPPCHCCGSRLRTVRSHLGPSSTSSLPPSRHKTSSLSCGRVTYDREREQGSDGRRCRRRDALIVAPPSYQVWSTTKGKRSKNSRLSPSSFPKVSDEDADRLGHHCLYTGEEFHALCLVMLSRGISGGAAFEHEHVLSSLPLPKAQSYECSVCGKGPCPTRHSRGAQDQPPKARTRGRRRGPRSGGGGRQRRDGAEANRVGEVERVMRKQSNKGRIRRSLYVHIVHVLVHPPQLSLSNIQTPLRRPHQPSFTRPRHLLPPVYPGNRGFLIQMAKLLLPPHSFLFTTPSAESNSNPHLFSSRIPVVPRAPRLPHPIPCSNSNPTGDGDGDGERDGSPSLARFLRKVPDWADAVKELGMRKRRPLYTPDDWREHRSSLRHLRHLLSSLSSRVILSLIPPVSALTAVAAALALYNSAVAFAWLPPGLFPLLRASSLPYQLTAPALALLLVFRTEASYSRFEEGRKAWMRVMAGASELAGIVMSVKVREDDAGVKRSLLNYIIAFTMALKVNLFYLDSTSFSCSRALKLFSFLLISLMHFVRKYRCVSNCKD
ncbi:hypothetical protein GW17_00024867 [Ensete ventricosum]|nr:hypothetical protein GW17_00024867 [Ensete ventricosum]